MTVAPARAHGTDTLYSGALADDHAPASTDAAQLLAEWGKSLAAAVIDMGFAV